MIERQTHYDVLHFFLWVVGLILCFVHLGALNGSERRHVGVHHELYVPINNSPSVGCAAFLLNASNKETGAKRYLWIACCETVTHIATAAAAKVL